MCSIPGSHRQPILGDGKLVGKFGKLPGKFFKQSPVLSTHIVLSKHDRGGASQRCAGPMGKQACDLNSLLLVICRVGCVLDLVQSRPRCGHMIRLRFVSSFPFTPSGMQFACQAVLDDHKVEFRDRVFTPQVTIWGFLSQVLSEDHSCRDAVSRIIAHRATNGISICSPNTASYCTARSRLLTSVLSTLAKRTAQELQASAADKWKWNGRSVFIVDGSSVSMPDTPENQKVYPQSDRRQQTPWR